MKLSTIMIPLILVLLAMTAVMALFNPSYAIFPLFLLFCVGAGLVFRPWGKGPVRSRSVLPPGGPSGPFETELSPETYSSVSRLDSTARRQEGNGKGPFRKDSVIKADLIARLAAEPSLRDAQIEVECRFGRVTLRGTVRAEPQRARAGEIAQATPGVFDVSVQLRTVPRRTA